MAKLRPEAIRIEAQEKLVEYSERDSYVSRRSRMFEFWNPSVKKDESIRGSRLYGKSATHVKLKTDTKMVRSIMETKPNKNANNIKVNADNKATNELLEAHAFAAGTSTGLNPLHENQVRRLMDESPYDERRLEVLRSSCVGQTREMINLFCAPMKSMTTAQRIEKAFSRLRQRYGVKGRLTSEPQIRSILHGPKVSHNSASLKLFNEDLNTLEVFAYAHNEYDKLSGQLLLDTASRLPNTLKKRYLDYLKKNNVSLNQPSFQSLRDFVLLEIEMTTSDYALAFFKSEDKDKTKEQIIGRGEVRVRRAAVGSGSGGQKSGTAVCGSGAVSGDGGTCASTGQRREMKQHQKGLVLLLACRM